MGPVLIVGWSSVNCGVSHAGLLDPLAPLGGNAQKGKRGEREADTNHKRGSGGHHSFQCLNIRHINKV